MDSSRRAVEAYWRTRFIDGVTSEEDKVAPVYKLEEVCELLRSSPAGIVKEVSDYILKRLDHKSPVVKQKTLRLIKYAVGKSGVEFRREMQRHSAGVRLLTHYKGYPDPLKGDALNKAVREMANETVSAIFAAEESKAAPTEGVGNRIEGFGNTNFSRSGEDGKSFLSEVVDLGKASIMQGLTKFAATHLRDNDENGNYGSYKSPTLRRSLTSETGKHSQYESSGGGWSSNVGGNSSSYVTWGQDSVLRAAPAASTNADDHPSRTASKTREERLLETIVTPGGVRLQPSRDALQTFLVEASKLNPLPMCHALESKLQSNLWQVRVKAVCVLDSILRKKDDEQLSVISSYFVEHKDCVIKCAESPQASLREKANKVLDLLEGQSAFDKSSHVAQDDITSHGVSVQCPISDLIDTGNPSDDGNENSGSELVNNDFLEPKEAGSLIDDLFGNDSTTRSETCRSNVEENPFADVSFHTGEEKSHVDDIFSGLSIEERSGDEITQFTINQASELTDIFSSNMDHNFQNKTYGSDSLATLAVNEVHTKLRDDDPLSFVTRLTTNHQSSYPHTSGEAVPCVSAQITGMHPNILPNLVSPFPRDVFLNQAAVSQTMSYGAMNNLNVQQQLQFQNFGSSSAGFQHSVVNVDGGYSSALPDIFRPTNNPVQSYGSSLTTSKKETKAFDFISDHVSAARGAKKVI